MKHDADHDELGRKRGANSLKLPNTLDILPFPSRLPPVGEAEGNETVAAIQITPQNDGDETTPEAQTDGES